MSFTAVAMTEVDAIDRIGLTCYAHRPDGSVIVEGR